MNFNWFLMGSCMLTMSVDMLLFETVHLLIKYLMEDKFIG